MLFYVSRLVALFWFFIKHRDENTLTDLSLGVFTVMNLLPPFNLIYSPVQLWFVI